MVFSLISKMRFVLKSILSPEADEVRRNHADQANLKFLSQTTLINSWQNSSQLPFS